jgi:pyruvate dehydrogenase E2 component (dihydrolipoyllysine-residue acetyltransferase)
MSPIAVGPPEPRLRDSTKISGRRATIARRMHDSLQNMAQLTLHARATLPKPTDDGGVSGRRASVGPTALVVYCVSRVLPRHTLLNATVQDGVLHQWESVNIGVAVAADSGLVVPVLREAQDRALGEIDTAIAVLAEKARTSQLEPDDVLTGTFTVTSLGAHRIEWFTPIVNPPQVAILGIGRQDEDGRLPLSLTFDHRVVDGQPAAAFLDDVLNALETRDGDDRA